MQLRIYFTTAMALLCMPHVAHAQLPGPVREMIDAAIETGDSKTVAAVVNIAKQTNPNDIAEIDLIHANFAAEQQALAKQKADAQRKAIRTASLFENWSGRGEIGAFRSTGNTDTVGASAGVKLQRKGIDWRHKLRALVEYQRSDGQTTRERYLFAYEPNIEISEQAFVYGLGQFERDSFQRLLARYSFSSGVGYRVVDTDDFTFSFQGGPAWRGVEFTDGTSDSTFSVLAAADLDIQLNDNLAITEDFSAYIEADNSTFVSSTGLEAGLGGDIKARLTYSIEYDTNPPDPAVSTDTRSRLTLVYDF